MGDVRAPSETRTPQTIGHSRSYDRHREAGEGVRTLGIQLGKLQQASKARARASKLGPVPCDELECPCSGERKWTRERTRDGLIRTRQVRA